MANLSKVNPGDLIRADFINELLAQVQDLQTRVAKLEANTPSDQVRIDTLTDEPITENDIVTITGVNFSPSTADNVVTVAEVTISTFKAFGNDKLIQFDMPHIPSIVDVGGSPVLITVRNKKGSMDAKTRVVRNKVLVPGGSGRVSYTQVAVPQADGKIHAGDAIKATFHVSATATMNGSYLLSASNDKNWPMQILGQNPFPLQAALAGQESTNDLVVQVTVPAGTADGVTATLSISAKELTPGSSVPFLNPSVAMTTGAKPQDPDSGVTLAPGPVFHGSFSNGKLLFNKTLGAAVNNNGNVAFNLGFSKAGSYQVDFSVASSAWKTGAVTNATPVVTNPIIASPTVAMTWDANAPETTLTVTISKLSQGGPSVVVAIYTVPMGLI